MSAVLFTVYQTTHLASGRVYIGSHKTEDPNDRYLGSGVRISRAVKKYGASSFVKEVLFVFDNPEAMIAKEKELVTSEFVARDNTFNIAPGGLGAHSLSLEGKRAVSVARKGKPLSAEHKAKVRAGNLGKKMKPESIAATAAFWRGRKHDDEARQRMSQAKKGRPGPKPTREVVAKRAATLKQVFAEKREQGWSKPPTVLTSEGLAALRQPKSEETRSRMRAAWVKRKLAKEDHNESPRS